MSTSKAKSKWAGRKLTHAAIETALQKSGGIVAAAAKLLDCSRRTLTHALSRDKRLRDARDNARDEALDLAESMLMKAVRRGNIAAICFYLKTQGRSRGYGTVLEVADANGALGVRFYVPKKDELPVDEPVAEFDDSAASAPPRSEALQ